MVFYGKYTFQSTNTDGPNLYITSSSNNAGQTYPFVSAAAVTEIEKFIVYQNSDQTFTIQMGSLYYLYPITVVGWLAGTTDITQAGRMGIVSEGSGLVKFQVYLTGQSSPSDVRYSVNVLLPYLIFPIPGGGVEVEDTSTYNNFTQVTLTPSLATIQSSKSAAGYDFINVDLTGADLTGVNCTGANFTNATLDNVVFNGANLTGATFVGASFNGTDFTGATLDGAVFTGTNLSTVKWGQAISAQRTTFDEVTGIGCTIGSSSLKKRANFTGASFVGADFSNSDFSNSIMVGANLMRSVFVDTSLGGVDFTAAQLGGVDGSAAANFSYAYMPNVKFDKANLYGVSFVSSSIYGALTSMANAATMEQADFSNAYMAGINLTSATLKGAKFSNACMINVNLTQADLSPTQSGSIRSSLVGACVQGTVFTAAKLQSADLSGATVSFANSTVNVRFCNPAFGGPFPPPPQFEPLNCVATASLDFTTLTDSTICPNGLTLAANRSQGNSLTQMLTIQSPATQWVPLRCSPTAEELELMQRAVKPVRWSPDDVVIQTAHAVLPKMSHRHLYNLRVLAEDPLVRKYAFANLELSAERMMAILKYNRVVMRDHGWSLWPVYRAVDRKFMGICGFSWSQLFGALEIQTSVLPEFRGDPIVKEVHTAVLRYGFDVLKLPVIYATIEVENVAAQRFAEREGLSVLRKELLEGIVECLIYSITAAEFARRQETVESVSGESMR